MSISSAIWLVIFLAAAALFIFYRRLAGFFRCFFFTAFTGIGALGLLWLLRLVVAVPLTITPLSLAVSGVLGIPGVLCMLILQLI